MSDIEIKALEKHNKMLKEHLKDQENTIERLTMMNKSHKTINGQLRVRLNRLEEENKKLRDKVADDRELIKDLYDFGQESMNEDYLKVDSRTLMKQLRELSMAENTLYKLYLETETEVKELHARLYKQYKQSAEKKTQEQLKADILLDPKYIYMKTKLVEYDIKYHEAKTSYQNKMTEISLLQSELKRELSFVAKESK